MNRRKGKKLFRTCRALVALILVGLLAYGGLLTAVLSGSHDDVQGDPSIMVILGCSVMPWGPSILLQDRLDTALAYLEDHPDLTVVVSGGQGPDEPCSEAQAMFDYLVEHGVNAQQILLEEHSSSTLENLTFTKQLLEDEGYDLNEEIVAVSNGFHLTRVRMLWDRIFGSTDQLSTLAAPSSHQASKLKMYIREPLALVKSFLIDR